MSRSQQGLLNLGILIVIVAVMIILGGVNVISWWEVLPLIIAFYGCWFIASAGIRTRDQSKYARSAFSLFGWGMLLAAIGFGWDLNVRGLSWIYTLAVMLLLLGILGVVAALKPPRKQA